MSPLGPAAQTSFGGKQLWWTGMMPWTVALVQGWARLSRQIMVDHQLEQKG